jgi:hypothetical protein
VSVGSDLKKAFQKVGVSYKVLRNSGTFSGEYLIYDIPATARSPFDREVVLDASLASDTIVVEGDVLELSNGKRVLVANKTPDIFQDATVIFETTLFKCNITSGELTRSSGEVWGSQEYHKEQIWESIKIGVNAVVIEVAGNQLSNQNESGLLNVSRLEMYIPSGEDVRVLDRFEARSGEYYRVDLIKKSLYPAISVVTLSEDTR